MAEQIAQDNGHQPAYRIGAAARLTGISTHTLRKWEDRYGVVSPRRSPGGERLYSARDVKRLALVKDLAQGGMALAELSALDVEELERLFRESHDAAVDSGPVPVQDKVRVAAVGGALPLLLTQDARRMRRVHIVASAETVEEAAKSLGGKSPDVLLLECPTVTTDSAKSLLAAMDALGAGAALVVYGFGARGDLDALRRPEVALVRAPADATEIERLCLGLVVSLGEGWPPTAVPRPLADEAVIAPPRWNPETLARVAGMSNSIACECPRHLADLVMSLTAFEEYSAGCESRDDKDAALHRYLRITAATSRALFEDALERVAAHEGLDID